MRSLHKLLREGEGWPETICGREGTIIIIEGRRFLKTQLAGKYELAGPLQAPTCRHCLSASADRDGLIAAPTGMSADE